MDLFDEHKRKKPEILAPAGNKASFLAALAAGADGVYCGLKRFSARMAADNFSFEELAALTKLAHERGVKVYIAFNTVLKQDELIDAADRLYQLKQQVHPDAIIMQDLSLVDMMKRVGINSELHLSTLANVSFPMALGLIKERLGVHRVVLPRELNIDEIKAMADACPKELGLEIFVHGALCYGISGRCYWSSYFGGKSGLRGRCVQPCRRRYARKGDSERYFSCQDLSLDVLVKVLMTIPEIKAWKIEGRKKGPHYVYYTVSAYKMLRDQGMDPQKKRAALELLSMALGRESTHYGFLPQRPQNPIKISGHTGSGMLVGYVQGNPDKPYITAKHDLLAGDYLRVGYEDDAWHVLRRVSRFVPKKGRFYLKVSAGKRQKKGTPVFLVDRREAHLNDLISRLEKEMTTVDTAAYQKKAIRIVNHMSKPGGQNTTSFEMGVFRTLAKTAFKRGVGVWLSRETMTSCPKNMISKVWWWLPPVLWPDNEADMFQTLRMVQERGARNFMVNAPWQAALFTDRKKAVIWAGPFCNVTNTSTVHGLKKIGFSGAVISPELGRADYMSLPGQSPIPLGIVLSGNWPLCISRTLAEGFQEGSPFTSPKGETAWAAKYGDEFWIFPNWKMDIRGKKKSLAGAGYKCFVYLSEPIPKSIQMKKRPGLWNWRLGLK